MSLDVYLRMTGAPPRQQGSGIFVREGGQNMELSREEWDRRYPGREPVIAYIEDSDDEVFSANVTHNLGSMAQEAGVYEACWRPEEIGITHAKQLIEPLRKAIVDMKASPSRFHEHDPPNGWGSYESFLAWLERYLVACEEYPEARVSVSR